MEGLLEALPRLAQDPAVGVVVLTGAGRAFCSGGDVKSMAEGSAERSVPEAVKHLRGRMEVSRLLHEIPKPTIAMVNGPAAGAGLSLALACDLRIAGQSARFLTAFAKMGFSGDFGGSYFLAKLVGNGKARELYYTAEPLDAAQALTLGVVTRSSGASDAGTSHRLRLHRRIPPGGFRRIGWSASGNPLSFCAELARRFPAVRVEPDPIFVCDGPVWTSAGVTAGIDLALALVEEDLGRSVALAVAPTWLCSSSVRAARRSSALLCPCKWRRTSSVRSMSGSTRIWPTTSRFRSWPARPG